ncbi:MAG: P pilus assembly protein, chaperone PapD [Methylacidiphilales bacterium]|nr:P pilus assembly protein, chaperone PapD [Candidatus Methylacidiphilales bacterium]
MSSFCFFPSQIKAQVRVSPTTIAAEAKRGQAQAIISVTNITDKPSRVRLYAEAFTYDRNLGFKTLPANSPNNLTPYLQFSPREFSIKPGETRRVRVIGRLAPNLLEGEYRAVVFNETLKESKDEKGNRVNLITRVGIPIYVAKGKIASNLVADSASFDTNKNQVKLLVRNTGKASVGAEVNWTLRSKGNIVRTGKNDPTAVIAESDRNIVLNTSPPSTSSKSPTRNEASLAPGTYELTGELIWGKVDKKKQSFNLTVTIPSGTIRKK